MLNVTTQYEAQGPESVVHKIKFSSRVIPGESILLLGPRGSSKTTFLNLLAGFQGPTSGQAYLFGRKSNEYPHKDLQSICSKKIGF